MDDAFPLISAPCLEAPRTFTQLLSATRRGARLARLLSVLELRSWGVPHCLRERAELVVAELAANAALHGSAPGSPSCDGFRVTLHYTPAAGLLRVDVTDSHGELLPRPHPPTPEPERLDELLDGGRGLSLVTALTDHWDTVPHPPHGKTVRAVLTLSRG
ncbi:MULTISPECIES: ATP-binding protein [unclassified Streptomyces]|uniref:ATP-binding protein n=1 Tax=unclassified Streptomyces TaxID=2593676 RepID=UPI000CD54877|nr:MULTISPECIES: ATP-binding protein [unclassified Streptomyces]